MQTAKVIAAAARRALPMPVRHAASVCTEDRRTDVSAIARTRRTSTENSAPVTERNKKPATCAGYRNRNAAAGRETNSVHLRANSAFCSASCRRPAVYSAETAGTLAAARP